MCPENAAHCPVICIGNFGNRLDTVLVQSTPFRTRDIPNKWGKMHRCMCPLRVHVPVRVLARGQCDCGCHTHSVCSRRSRRCRRFRANIHYMCTTIYLHTPAVLRAACRGAGDDDDDNNGNDGNDDGNDGNGGKRAANYVHVHEYYTNLN